MERFSGSLRDADRRAGCRTMCRIFTLASTSFRPARSRPQELLRKDDARCTPMPFPPIRPGAAARPVRVH